MTKANQLVPLLIIGLTLAAAGCNSEAPEKQASATATASSSVRSNSNSDDELNSDLSVSIAVSHTNLYLRFKYDCKDAKNTFDFLKVTEQSDFTNGKDDSNVHQMKWAQAFEEEDGSVLNIRTLRMEMIKSWQIHLAFLPTGRKKAHEYIKSNTLVLTGEELLKEAGEAWEGGDSYEMLVTATCKDGDNDSIQIQRSAWTVLSTVEK